MTWMLSEEETPAERAQRLLTAGLLDDGQQMQAVLLDLLTIGQVSPAAALRLTNGVTLDAQAAAAGTRLTAIIAGAVTIINDATISNTEVPIYLRQIAAAVQDMARYQRAEIRLLRGYVLGHPESLDVVDP